MRTKFYSTCLFLVFVLSPVASYAQSIYLPLILGGSPVEFGTLPPAVSVPCNVGEIVSDYGNITGLNLNSEGSLDITLTNPNGTVYTLPDVLLNEDLLSRTWFHNFNQKTIIGKHASFFGVMISGDCHSMKLEPATWYFNHDSMQSHVAYDFVVCLFTDEGCTRDPKQNITLYSDDGSLSVIVEHVQYNLCYIPAYGCSPENNSKSIEVENNSDGSVTFHTGL